MHVKVATLENGLQSGTLGDLLTPLRAALLIAAIAGLLVIFWPLGLAADYMNHLARNYIESQIWFDADLRKNYTVAFAFIPDLTMDMVVPWLAHITGIYAAGALMIWTAYVMPPLAGLFIAKTLHGRVSWIALLGFLAMFNQNTQWGFVNYAISTGIALLGFAFWIRCIPGWRRTLAFAPFGIFLAFSHALGFLLFGYVVLLWEIGSFADGQRGSPRAFIRQLITLDAPAMLPGLAVIALSLGGAGQLPHVGSIDFSPLPKIASLWSGASFFNPAFAKLVTIVVGCGFWLGFRRGVLKMDPRMIWVCGGLLALIVAMPTSIFGIWGLHFRYPAVLIILAAASTEFAPGHRRLARQASIVAAALLAIAFFNASTHMSRIDGLARDQKALLAGIPKGSRVLPARNGQTDPLLTLHAAALSVIESSAFVPNLFTNTSPVGVAPELRALHMPQAWPLLEQELATSAGMDLPPASNGYWSPTYYYGWSIHWDYVLYFRSEADQSLVLPLLCKEAETASAILYRVSDSRRCGADRDSDLVPASPDQPQQPA